METQREQLAKHGIDHDKYDVFLSKADHLEEETTGIMVSEISTGNFRRKTVDKSRRQLAEPGDSTYIDTIVKLVHELEEQR